MSAFPRLRGSMISTLGPPPVSRSRIRDRRRGDQHSESGSRGGRVVAAARSVARTLLGRRGQAVTAAAHDLARVRCKLPLRAVSGHDKQKQMLGVRLSFGHVYKAPSYARRKRNDVARSEIHELIFRSLVPGATPTAGDRHERLVRVVIVHERASPGLAAGKSEIEALRDRNGRQPSSRRADRRNNVALIIRRLETDDIDKFAFAFRQIAVRQPGLRSFQILEERDSFHHLVAGPTAHGRYHGCCVSLIRPKLQKAKSRKIVLRSVRFSHPVTLTSLVPMS